MTPLPYAPTVPELAAANQEARHTLGASDQILIAHVANGGTHKALARRYGVTKSAVSMRLNRAARARGLITTPQLVADAVREGRITWTGTRWEPTC